ncbi:MAG: FtsX-like permease family protein [Arachnia sp.]
MRLLLSALSVVLGIALVSGSLIFTNLLSESFNAILTSAVADVNVRADPDAAAAATPTMDEQVYQQIIATAGVDDSAGLVSAANLYPLDPDGSILNLAGAPGIGTSWHELPAVGGQEGPHIIDGAAPATDSEVAIDPTTLERGGYVVGDQIDVYTPSGGTQTYTISGTATYGAGATAGASYLFFTLAEARDLILDGAPGYTGAWITTGQADPDEVADAVNQLLPAGLIAETGQERAEVFADVLEVGLGLVNTFLLIFAGIALVVASLLILNTFSILVAQRSRELALFRALGARRSQVRNSVLFEAGVVGLVGASLGIAVGYLLAWAISIALTFFGIELGTSAPTLTVEAILVSYAVGLVITIVAAHLPARRASATRPVEAMSIAAGAGPVKVSAAAYAGIAMIEIGAGAAVCGLWLDVPIPLAWAGLGCAMILVGAVLSAAIIGRPLIWVFGGIYRLLFRHVGTLASLNARRQPGRTAATAATLMIGLSLVGTVAIIANSTTTSIRAGITEDQRGDFVISPVDFRPFTSQVVTDAQAVPGVEQVWWSGTGETSYEGETFALGGTTPASLTDGLGVSLLAGQLSPGSAVLTYETSQALDLPMGTVFDLPTLDGGTMELLVSGILDNDASSRLGDIVVTWDDYSQLGDDSLVTTVAVKVADQADLSEVRAGLDEAVDALPTVVVTNNQELADQQVAQFDLVFAVIYGLLGLAITISVLGIVNTLGLSIMERTREIGLLRAVGLTRGQLRRMITLESVIVAALGSSLGLALSLGFGWAIVRLLADTGIDRLAIPWTQLALFLVAAGGFGVLAAILPARRAARMNTLAALAVE